MHFRLFHFILVVLLLGGLTLAEPRSALASTESIKSLSKNLSAQLLESLDERPRVTVLDFTDIRNRPNELGRYLALSLANEMVMLREVSVLDRANLETIMAEHELTAAGLLRPEDAKKLGQFAGVDAILIGNISAMGHWIEVIVRAISTETSEIIASGRANLEATSELRQMLGMQVDSGAAPGVSRGASSGIAAVEGDAIAVREVGPLAIVLRNVTRHTIQFNGNQHPSIRCTFDLNNRSLEHTAVVAVNRIIREGIGSFVVDGFRGDLVDSRGVRWKSIEVRGVPGVSGFQTPANTRRVHQPDPAAVVRYIQTATRYEGESIPHREAKTFWSGHFSEIQPGDTLRMTVDFVRASESGGRDQDPEHFQLDMELVLGTAMGDEAPEKAADLRLRNLTIDRVEMPSVN